MISNGMKMTYVYILVVVLAVGGIIFAKNGAREGSGGGEPTQLDVFAQCLADAGAKFYGAYWCPHCQAQKRLFENSKKLPYVECSTPNGKAQTQECNEKNITGYPTWILLDGTRLDGEQTLATLGEKTNCVVPTQ